MSKNTAITTPTVLAFERKLSVSDARLYSGQWQQDLWQPISVQSKAVKGTISNRQKDSIAGNPAKMDAEIQKANLQQIETAALPAQHDTLKVVFSLRVLGELHKPSVCNQPAYQQKLQQIITAYSEQYGFEEVAHRYACNIANGRFLWRNRTVAEQINIRVRHNQQHWQFDSQQFSLHNFQSDDKQLQQLATLIAAGLKGQHSVLLQIEAQAQIGEGQEVYPSQELILDSNATNKKVLYQVGGIAAMHSQKIGNALRTIDTWHPYVDEYSAIAIEPYGAITNRGVACRQPKQKDDFYTLLDNWILNDKQPQPEQQHYVMAVLIRGGVFGGKSE